MVRAIGEQYENENIDEEEHDLLIEAIEDADPEGRTFGKLTDSSDEFYDSGEMPDSPKLKLGKRKNLDDLMKAQGNEFVGSFGRDEFDEFKRTMAADFYADSDDAIAAGDHNAEIRTQNRVFADAEDGIDKLKKQMAQESGLEHHVEEEEEDENYYVDEDDVEWWRDDEGYWWYREPGQEDWQPHEE